MADRQAIKFYDKALAAHQQGRLSEAERAYKKAISISADFVEAHNNLGNVLMDRGRLKEATMAYRKAQSLLPNHPMLLSNVGNALQRQGDNEQAIQWFQKAIQQDANYADAYNNLGNALAATGAIEPARKAYHDTLRINPGQVGAYTNLANIELELENYAEAENGFRKALSLQPNQLEAAIGLGSALFEQEKYTSAISVYRKALLIDPNSVVALTGLGNALCLSWDLDEAITSFEKAIKIEPGYFKAYIGLGKARGDIGDREPAIAALQQAIDLAPDHTDAKIELANLYSNYGQIDLAISLYRDVIELDPDNSDAYRVLAKNRKFSEKDADLEAMETLYTNDQLPETSRMHLAFALGKAYEDLQQFEQSFECIATGNRLKRNTISYQTSDTQSYFENIKQTFSKEFFADRNATGSADSTPIFILGMPRSGTSLAEQILASHPDVYGAGELMSLSKIVQEQFAAADKGAFPEAVDQVTDTGYQAMGETYLSSIKSLAANSKRITDKMPHNFQYVGLIKLILPNAKVIHCRRDPMDTCLSIYKHLFTGKHDYAYEMTELGQYYRLYQELMEHWCEVLPGFVYHLDYELLVENQESQTRCLLDFCELDWDPACLAFEKTRRKVRTASNAQVRRPMYKDSVALWRRYEKQLRPLYEIINGQISSAS